MKMMNENDMSRSAQQYFLIVKFALTSRADWQAEISGFADKLPTNHIEIRI
jgi:hypothetical protein